MLSGWPANFPFKNLSEFSCSLTELENLFRSLCSGKIHWHELSEEELDKMTKERDNGINDGTIEEPAPRRRRSDYGKKRHRNVDAAGPAIDRPSRKHKSRSVVESDEESDGPPMGPPLNPAAAANTNQSAPGNSPPIDPVLTDLALASGPPAVADGNST